MSGKSIFRRLDETGVAIVASRLLVGGAFVYMGFSKLGDPVTFLKNIRLFQMLPEDPPYLLNATAIVLPWLEVLCGSALLLGVWIRGAAAVTALLLCVFTPAILWRALGIHFTEGTPFFKIAFDCGCGGGPSIIWIKLLENIGLSLLAVVALFSQSRRLSLTHLLDRRREAAAWCRRCGYALSPSDGSHCPNCRQEEAVPMRRAETAVS